MQNPPSIPMKHQTLQAVSTLTKVHLSYLDATILEIKNGISYWLPKCDIQRKSYPDVREAYSRLNELKNRLRTLHTQRAKWTEIHKEILSGMKRNRPSKNSSDI